MAQAKAGAGSSGELESRRGKEAQKEEEEGVHPSSGVDSTARSER